MTNASVSPAKLSAACFNTPQSGAEQIFSGWYFTWTPEELDVILGKDCGPVHNGTCSLPAETPEEFILRLVP